MRQRPDIVVISTQADFHYELGMRVLDLGVNIDVEKPHCEDLAQADAMLARAKARGVRIAVHHQYRKGVVMRALLKVFNEGRIGRVHHIEGNCKGYYGGYGLMDIGCHLINNFVKFGGHCKSVDGVWPDRRAPRFPPGCAPLARGHGHDRR